MCPDRHVNELAYPDPDRLRRADRGLCDVIRRNFERLSDEDRTVVLRILDHIHVVDRIFQSHLLGLAHAYRAARSAVLPQLELLAGRVRQIDDWYAFYVAGLSRSDYEQPIDFVFTDGTPVRMLRGEIILHVCLHGTYHRGNVGIVLQKNGINPNGDRITDFLANRDRDVYDSLTSTCANSHKQWGPNR